MTAIEKRYILDEVKIIEKEYLDEGISLSESIERWAKRSRRKLVRTKFNRLLNSRG